MNTGPITSQPHYVGFKSNFIKNKTTKKLILETILNSDIPKRKDFKSKKDHAKALRTAVNELLFPEKNSKANLKKNKEIARKYIFG